MFLRKTRKSEIVDASVEGQGVERRSKPRGGDARKLFQVIPGNQAIPVPNIITHIVRRYAQRGIIRLPNSTGGRAFALALRDKGVQVTV